MQCLRSIYWKLPLLQWSHLSAWQDQRKMLQSFRSMLKSLFFQPYNQNMPTSQSLLRYLWLFRKLPYLHVWFDPIPRLLHRSLAVFFHPIPQPRWRLCWCRPNVWWRRPDHRHLSWLQVGLWTQCWWNLLLCSELPAHANLQSLPFSKLPSPKTQYLQLPAVLARLPSAERRIRTLRKTMIVFILNIFVICRYHWQVPPFLYPAFFWIQLQQLLMRIGRTRRAQKRRSDCRSLKPWDSMTLGKRRLNSSTIFLSFGIGRDSPACRMRYCTLSKPSPQRR